VYPAIHEEQPARFDPWFRAGCRIDTRDSTPPAERSTMTLFWSALALVQVAFLPGYIAARWLRLDDGIIKTGAVSLAFSLVLNYHATLLLTALGAYTRTSLCALIGAEILALAWMLRRPRAVRAAGPSSLTRYLCPDGASAGVSVPRALLLLAGIFPLLEFGARVPEAFTTVFGSLDALVSINRWALDWTAGMVPAWTMHYPQLLPAAWSMLYVLAGGELQFLSKGLSLFFPAATVCMLVDLGLRKNRASFILAAALTGVLMSHTGGRYIASGFLDLAGSFFAMATFYALACGDRDADPATLRRHVLAATVCAAGCALTKQAGIFLACVFPLLVWLRLRRRSVAAAEVRVARTLAAVALTLALFIAPWNVYKELQVREGFETHEAAASPGVHRGRSLPERLARSWELWEADLSPPVLSAVVLCVGASLAARRALPLTLGITIPFTLIWALYFSYDRRNLALAFPYIGISAGIGAAFVWDQVAQRWKRLAPPWRRWLGGAAVALVAVATPWIFGADLERAHDRRLREVGNPKLNAFLYAYHAQHGFEGRIFTNYRVLSVLPELRDHVYFDRNATANEFWPFRDPEAFRTVFERERDDLRYIVLQKPANWAIQRFIVDGIHRGELQPLYRTEVGIVVRISESH
jgi:hypothetical protein